MRPFAALVALTIAFSGPAASHADERSAPQVMATRLLSAPQPARDPFDLAVRLRGLSPATPLVASVVPAPLVAGFTDTFWILDQRSAALFQAIASLRLVSDHAYWFVQSDLLNRASQTDIERSADVFETHTYPLIHRYFGSEPMPGVDGDGHIVVLMANVPGVAAYFSSADTYPRAINPRSNQHDMIYVNLSALRPGAPTFDATLAHEFQHMANFAACPGQEGWVDEGASELATRIAGYDSPPPVAFVTHPDIQLTTWSTQPTELTRHYQAAYLFLRYVAERAGGWQALPDLLKTCARGEQLFADFLASDPIAPDFDSLFSDWAVANLVQDPSVADGRYAYANSTLHASIGGVAGYQSPFLGSAPPYAASYVDLPADAGRLTFRGEPSVALLPVSADGAGMWWSNRGDNLDSRLTRRLDLRGIHR
ncbi:MAG TPA: hypothetical protein VF937_16285, partial [Chloroflexota bacterium]